MYLFFSLLYRLYIADSVNLLRSYIIQDTQCLPSLCIMHYAFCILHSALVKLFRRLYIAVFVNLLRSYIIQDTQCLPSLCILHSTFCIVRSINQFFELIYTPDLSTPVTPFSFCSLAITLLRCSTLFAVIVRFIRVRPSFVSRVLIPWTAT